MSLYAEYVQERGIDNIVESEKGFATYRYLNDGTAVYIVDIYVKPEYRRSGAAKQLADIIATEARSVGVNTMIGTVLPKALGSTESLKVLIAYGMTLHEIAEGLIVFKKEI